MSQGSEISLANLPVDVNLRSSYHAMANLLLIRHSAANSNMSGRTGGSSRATWPFLDLFQNGAPVCITHQRTR